jgi:hypothetical protein
MSKELESVLRILNERKGDIYPFDGFSTTDVTSNSAIKNFFAGIDDKDKVETARGIIEHASALQQCLFKYLFELLESRNKTMLEELKQREHEIATRTAKKMTFTVPEIVAISGKAKNTIYAHLKNGKLIGHSDKDGLWTITREDLEKYLHRSDF